MGARSLLAIAIAFTGAALTAGEPSQLGTGGRTSLKWEDCAWQKADPTDTHRRACWRRDTGEYRFRIPPELAQRPIAQAHVDRVNAELAEGMDMVASHDRADAKAAGLAFAPWQVSLDWQVTGLNTRLASLIGYATLGPRPSRRPGKPSSNAISILVDETTGTFLTAASDAFSDRMESVRATYCAHLDIQRIANALDADPSAGSKGKPSIIDTEGRYLGKWHCPYMDDLAIGFAGAPGAPFDRIIMVAQPMSAGPEEEGFYRVEVALTPAMVAQIRPEYRDGFRAARSSDDGKKAE